MTYNNEVSTRLIEENKGLVIMVAKKFLNRGYEMDDLIQLGNIGLFKAIKNFDKSKNVKFSTYAVPLIMGEIRQFIRDDNIIKVSRDKKDLYYKIISAKEDFFKKNGYEPSISDLTNLLNISYEDIISAINALKAPEYIHQESQNGTYLVDTLKSSRDEFCDKLLDRIFIADVINTLDEFEKKVFYLRYYKDTTQAKIGKILGVSQVKVHRTETKILKSIRRFLQ